MRLRIALVLGCTLVLAWSSVEAAYVERAASWTPNPATELGLWVTKDLSGPPFNVPASAVVEIAVRNSDPSLAGGAHSAGVRDMGSGLQRVVNLHQADGGGFTYVTMHAQTDASSQIQFWADAAENSFQLLGYWDGDVAYDDEMRVINAPGGGLSWVDEDLSGEIGAADEVAEIAFSNQANTASPDTDNRGRWAGVRADGSTLERRVLLDNAARWVLVPFGGGENAATLFVNPGSAKTVELYAEDDEITFYVLGSFTRPPGTFVELAETDWSTSTGLGSPAAAHPTWEDRDLSAWVPAKSVAEMLVGHSADAEQPVLGVRSKGSSLDRTVQPHDAGLGTPPMACCADDGQLARLHVNTDVDGMIEWASNTALDADDHFLLSGYWVPRIRLTGTGTVAAGVSYTLNLSVTHPGADPISGWVVNWGDGSIQTIVGNPSSVDHTYAQGGFTYNILASVTDGDVVFFDSALLVANAATGADGFLLRFPYDPVTGRADVGGVQVLNTTPVSDLDWAVDVVVGPDGDIYATGYESGNIVRFDGSTGASSGEFASMTQPVSLAFGPDGNLYVASDLGQVKRFDGELGTFINDFVTVSYTPEGMKFGPDGNLYLAEYSPGRIFRYDGKTGAALDGGAAFIDPVATGTPDDDIAFSEQFTFGPDGNLYVASQTNGKIQRYSGTDGAHIDTFANPGTQGAGWPRGPTGVAFGPDGNLYVTRVDRVLRYDAGIPDTLIDDYVPAGSGLDNPWFMTFAPQHQVWVPFPVVVNSTGGSSDNNPGDGLCDTGGMVGPDPECTLRAAIEEANAPGVVGAIHFEIPAPLVGGAHPITVGAGGLPWITDRVLIDGTTDSDFAGTPIIELDGTASGNDGLHLDTGSDGSTIRGFVINNWTGSGIEIQSDDNKIVGNYLGTNVLATAIEGNTEGIFVSGADNRIGGTDAADANIISGNANEGIDVQGAASVGTVIQGNYIGTNPGGDNLGNLNYGVLLWSGATDSLVGGTTASAGNVIAYNDFDGVAVVNASATGHSILGNRIYANDENGIDLADNGVTENDGGDADPGPNDLLNFPVITTATESSGLVTVGFDLDVPNGLYRVEFFRNPSGADPSGNGEGEIFAGSVDVSVSAGVPTPSSAVFAGSGGDILTATATEGVAPPFGSTSEFGDEYTATALNPVITLPGGAVNYAPGDPATVIDPAATVSDPDSTDFDLGTLTVDLATNGTANDRLAIRDQGPGGGNIALSGMDVTYEAVPGSPVVIGSFTGGGDGMTPLVVTLNANADLVATRALLRNITYQNVAADPDRTPRTVRFALTDGDGGSSLPQVERILFTGLNGVLLHAYFVPVPDEQVRSWAVDIDQGSFPPGDDMRVVVSITVTLNGTRIVYDHWEDGFETDLANPTQATTEIWGDGLASTGCPPTVVPCIDASDYLDAGDVLALENDVPANPRDPAAVFFDGGDLIDSTEVLAVTRAGWPVNVGSFSGVVLAGAVEVYQKSDWGVRYLAPVGEDLGPHEMFEYTAFSIMAAEDGTLVSVDVDGNGTIDQSATLDRGESLLAENVLTDGEVLSSKPVQVDLLTGDVNSTYEARWFALQPLERWSSVYYTPVGQTDVSAPVTVFAYNPGASAITVNYETLSGTGSFLVLAGSIFEFTMPANSGARFASAGGEPFYALSTIDFDSTTYDWGFSLIPEDFLATAAAVGWAPGSFAYTVIDGRIDENRDGTVNGSDDGTIGGVQVINGEVDVSGNGSIGPEDDGPFGSFTAIDGILDLDGDGTAGETNGEDSGVSVIVSENGSPVWVTADRDTTLEIDYNGDGTPEQTVTLNRLQSLQVFDGDNAPAWQCATVPDCDQTGMRLSTTNGALITAAYGQDPSVATAGSPSLDLGTSVLPFINPILVKEATLKVDLNGNGLVDPGDTLRYSLVVKNVAPAPLVDPVVVDTPDANVTYELGTTQLDGVAIADDAGPATPYPLDESGYTLPTIQPGDIRVFTYELTIDDPLPVGVLSVRNDATVNAGDASTSARTLLTVTIPGLRVVKTSNAPGALFPGDIVTYTITVSNPSPLTAEDVYVQDALPVGTSYLAQTTVATGPGPLVLDNIPGGANPDLMDGTPTDLVLPTDDFDLAQGENLIVTFDVQVLDPLPPDLPRIVNTAIASTPVAGIVVSDQVIDPVSPGGEIGDLVWLDVDGDGVWDLGEPGFANVEVELLDGACTPGVSCAKTVTDGSGRYGFTRLVPGTYQVQIDETTLPPGLARAPGTINPNPFTPGLVITSTESYLKIDFGYVPAPGTGVIGDFVWSDADNDGIQDLGEIGIGGVTVDLVRAKTLAFVARTTTAADGSYLFSGVAAGRYRVDVTDLGQDLLPSTGDEVLIGYTLTVGTETRRDPSPPIEVEGERPHLKNDFGYYQAGLFSIDEVVWLDADADGLRGPAEKGIPGVSVTLRRVFSVIDGKVDLNGDGMVDTADDGFAIGVEIIDGLLDLDGSGTVDGADDGLFNGLAVIDGFLDLDDDGAAGETNGDDTGTVEPVVSSTLSDANGGIAFSGLEAGDYRLVLGDVGGVLVGLAGTTAPASAFALAVAVGPSHSGVSFGYTRPGTIGDRVWSDADGDGLQDPGEPGLAGIRITLWRDEGDGLFDGLLDPMQPDFFVASTTTDAAGNYSFTGLEIGSYFVSIDETQAALAGATRTTADEQTGPNAAGAQLGSILVVSDASDLSVDFGFQEAALFEISGNVFEDLDTDGFDDGAGEPGIEGVTLDLIPVFTVIDGRIDVDGDGMVDASDDGWVDGVEVIDGELDLSGDGTIDAADDGLFGSFGVLDGVLDLDGDGTAGETNGDDSGEIDGPPVATATTDAQGDYLFSDVQGSAAQPRDYRVRVTDTADVLKDYRLTSGLDAIKVRISTAGISGLDFGYVRDATTASIGDRVWFDADRDGFQGAAEAGIAGVTLDLIDVGPDLALGGGDDVVVATATTDANGNYSFAGLEPGTYVVDVTDTAMVLTGLAVTGGTDPSDVIPLSEGENYDGANFGYSSSSGSAVGDTIWYDDDGDGVADPGEIGIPGVTVELIDPGPDGQRGTGDDVLIGSDETDARGRYLFTGVAAGLYFVVVDPSTLPPGYNTTPTNGPAARPFDVSAGLDLLWADFGFAGGTTGTIGDRVYLDADGDGIEDAGEAGIGGVTIDLLPTYAVISGRLDVDGDGTVDGADDRFVDGFDIVDGGLDLDRNGVIDGADDGLFKGFTVIDGELDLDGDASAGETNGDDNGVIRGEVAATTITGDGTVDVNGDNMVDADDLGYYEFAGPPPGDWDVFVTDISGVLALLNPTATPTLPINVPPTGGLIDTVDFGYAASGGTGAIGGTLWHDTLQPPQGVLDAGESGIEGVTVELWLDTDGNKAVDAGVDNRIRIATTDGNGDYSFLGIPLGDYLVTVSDEAGVLVGFQGVSGPSPGTDGNGQSDPYARTLTSGTPSDFTADFAYEAATPQILSGTAFFDLNGNGSIDAPDDFGVEKVRLLLFRDLDGDMMLDAGEPQLGTTLVSDGTVDVDGDTVIDPVGYYAFTDLPDGTYLVAADPSQSFVDGLMQTTQLAPPQPQGGLEPATISGGPSAGNHFGFTAQASVVLISSFEARSDAGGVRVRWETGSQSGTVGFYLYRLDADGGWLPVNERLLPAVLDAPQGAVYELLDPTAPRSGRLVYALVEVEAAGGERTYGRFTPRVDERPSISPDLGPARVDGSRALARRPSARMERRLEAMAAARDSLALKSSPRLPHRPGRRPMSTDKRLKIEVQEDGLHGVSAADIATHLALPPGAVRRAIETGSVALSRGGEPVAWEAAVGGLVFFGERVESRYTTSNVYWLDLGRGAAMPLADAGGAASGATSFAETVHFEEDVFSVTVVASSPVEDFYYWAFVMAGDPTSGVATVYLEVDDPVAGAPAQLAVELQGVTSTPASIDHRAVVRLNGFAIGTTEWNGAAPHAVVLALPAGLLLPGENTLEIEGLLDGGLPYSTFLLDSVELAYERELRASVDRLLFTTDAAGPVRVSGFSAPGVALYDVTAPETPARLVGAIETLGDGWTIGFTAAAGGRYLAVGAAGVQAPASLRARPEPRLGEAIGGVDYVVIAPPELAAGAQALVDYRMGYGLPGRVFDLEAIQDVFAGGLATPEAIRDFLSWAWTEWSMPPRFAVLAGAGNFDYKGVQGIGGNLVPPLMTATPYGLFASDALFGDVAGDDGVPEIAIGRIPALTDAELEAFVAKMAAHEAAGGGPSVLLLADNPDAAGNFPADSDGLLPLLPPAVTTERVYLSEHGVTTARQMLFAAVAGGVGAVNYIGHGGLNRLADEGLLLATDAGALVGPELPIFAALTCSAGRFEVPGYESLAEALVMAPNSGSAAVFAPTGQSLNFEAVEMNRVWIEALFSGAHGTVGEVVLEALAYEQLGPFPFMRRIYNLLGDPAFGLP